jgi:quercetin dioxygenase-like cupin family protein
MNGPLSTAAILMVLAIAPLAQATPPKAVNYTLVIDPDAADRVQISPPAPGDYVEDATLSHGVRSPSVFVFQLYTAGPGSSTGWHYHPGIVFGTVVEGSLNWYDSHCFKHTYNARDFFVENDRELHEVRNNHALPAQLILTFIIAKGLTHKISAPAPTCAAPLGLR